VNRGGKGVNPLRGVSLSRLLYNQGLLCSHSQTVYIQRARRVNSIRASIFLQVRNAVNGGAAAVNRFLGCRSCEQGRDGVNRGGAAVNII